MAEFKRVSALEVNEDLEFQRHDWVVQRVGWVVIAAAVIAALLGLFGVGLLSRAAAGNQGAPISIGEYQRMVRFGKPTTFRVHLDGAATEGKEARVWLSREYLENVQLQEVTPEPEMVEAGPDRFTYFFEVAEPGKPTAVTFNLVPDKVGPLEGRVGLQGGKPLGFEQFVYP